MEYREHAPVSGLAAFVTCVWTLTGHAREMDGSADPVFPDGQPELILHFGDRFDRISHRGMERQPAVLFAGQLTEQLTLKPSGRIGVLGIRFRPFGAAALLNLRQQEIAGSTIPVSDLDADLGRALKDVLNRTDDPADAASVVQDVLLRRMDGSRIDPRVRAAVTAILHCRGMVDVDDVARRAGITRRHLERRFLEHVGIGPKRLARIARFQRALRVLDEVDPRRRGTETATDCGYADQSHFIRDFRELAGCSPSEHLLNRGRLTGFFILNTGDPAPESIRSSQVI